MNAIKEYVLNRMHGWGLLALALCAVAFVWFGDSVFSRLAQILFIVVRLGVGAAVGYWVAKAVLRDVRPKNLTTAEGRHYMYMRSYIVAASIVGAGFAV